MLFVLIAELLGAPLNFTLEASISLSLPLSGGSHLERDFDLTDSV